MVTRGLGSGCTRWGGMKLLVAPLMLAREHQSSRLGGDREVMEPPARSLACHRGPVL